MNSQQPVSPFNGSNSNMFSHYYELIRVKRNITLALHISPCQIVGKDKEIKDMVTNAEQRKGLNIQGREEIVV